MSAETLLSAARRAVRFFKIDEARGGFTTTDTVQAVETLRRQIALAETRPADPALLDAARKMEVCFGIDEANGGLLSIDTLKRVEGLDRQVRRITAAQRAQEVA